MANRKKNVLVNTAPENLAVIYARYSPGPRQTDQSIEGQVRDCKAYAEANGLKIVGIYADRHISGSDFENRDDFNRMIRDAEKMQFRYIIVWKVDRFGRDREEIALNKVRVKRFGVKLLYAKENIPDGPEGIILEGLLESLSEYYIADLRQKVKRGQRESAIKGFVNGGGRAYGYDIVDKRLTVNDVEASVVLKIFQMWDGGYTAPEICSYLSSAGILRRDGKPFTPSTVYHILRNPKYIGVYYYDDIAIPCPQIVPLELYQSCHSKFKTRIGQASSYKATEKYLFSLKIQCGECGDMMVGECGYGKAGKRYSYYKCATRKRKGGKCKLRTFRKDYLEELVVNHTIKEVLNTEVMEYIADRVMEIQEKQTVNYVLKGLRKQYAEAEKARNNIMKAIEAGIITDSTKNRLIELENQLGELDVLIAQEEIKRPPLTHDHVLFWLEQFRDGDVSDPDFVERLCDVFIHTVVCYNEKVVIIYNFSDANNNHSIRFSDVLRCSDEHPTMRHSALYPNIIVFSNYNLFGLVVNL